MSTPAPVMVVAGDALARYGFGNGHPFGPDRQACFLRELRAQGLAERVLGCAPRIASDAELVAFHTLDYLDFVRRRSASGEGFLDGGDTPAFRGVYQAAAAVVGATLTAAEALVEGRCRRAFVPIAGLHHAARPPARSSICRCRPGRTTGRSPPPGTRSRRSSAVSRAISSCSSAARTAWPVIP